MKSFRAKPTGWQRESARHSLAAKGIRTKNAELLKRWGLSKSSEIYVDEKSGRLVAAYDKKEGIGETIADAELQKLNRAGRIMKVKHKEEYFSHKNSLSGKITPASVQAGEALPIKSEQAGEHSGIAEAFHLGNVLPLATEQAGEKVPKASEEAGEEVGSYMSKKRERDEA